MMPHKNKKLHKEMKNTGNGINYGEYKIGFLFLIF